MTTFDHEIIIMTLNRYSNLCDHGESDEVEDNTTNKAEDHGVPARFTKKRELVDECDKETFDDGEL